MTNQLGYNVSHLVLSLEYLVLFIVVAICYLRLVSLRKIRFVWQYAYFLFLSMGCIARALYLDAVPLIYTGAWMLSNRWSMIFSFFPSLWFLSSYLIILYHWACLYHTCYLDYVKPVRGACGNCWSTFVQSVQRSELNVIAWIISLVVYTAEILLIIADFCFEPTMYQKVPNPANITETIIADMTSIMYFFTSIFFFAYGILVFQLFKTSCTSFNSKRKSVARKILFVSIFVPAMFLLRMLIVAVASDRNLSAYWWFDIVYYTLFEISPMTFLLITLLQLSSSEQRTDEIINDPHQDRNRRLMSDSVSTRYV